MRIFAFEYITGGGLLGKAVPEALRREGDMMLHALVNDLLQVPGTEVLTLRDAALPGPVPPIDVRYVADEEAFASAWAACLNACDAVWPVAPETAGILEDIVRRVFEAGVPLLGSRPEGVRIAASKRLTAEVLSEHGVAVVPLFALDAVVWQPGESWVVKPDDGVGCMGIRMLRTAAELERLRAKSQAPENLVAQRFVSGTPVSLCLLCNQGRARLLSTNLQRMVMDNDAFKLLGCTVNARQVQDPIYHDLAAAIAAAMPGLWGIVGVDLIAKGDRPQVIEVNPRLTTSYVGLHRSIGVNPAGLVLETYQQDALPECSFVHQLPVDVAVENAHVA